MFRAFAKFDKSLPNSGLVIRKEKCGVLWPSLATPPPDSLRNSVTGAGLTLHCGVMQTLGVLVGSGDPQIHEWLERHIASHQPLLDTIVHLELPAQVAMLLLRLSVVSLLGYLTRVRTQPLSTTRSGLTKWSLTRFGANSLSHPPYPMRLFSPLLSPSGQEDLVSRRRLLCPSLRTSAPSPRPPMPSCA